MKDGRVLDEIAADFADQGYRVATWHLYCPDYGLSQHRERVFFVCVRDDVSGFPESPPPTFFAPPTAYRMFVQEPLPKDSPLLASELFTALGRIAREGPVSILMVEQNARRALAMASRAYLLSVGRIVGEGDAPVLACDSARVRSYLGL